MIADHDAVEGSLLGAAGELDEARPVSAVSRRVRLQAERQTKSARVLDRHARAPVVIAPDESRTIEQTSSCCLGPVRVGVAGGGWLVAGLSHSRWS